MFSKFVPMVANDTVDSTNGVTGCRKNVHGYVVTYCYWLLIFVQLEQGQVVIPTGSMIKGSRPFYWIPLKLANLSFVVSITKPAKRARKILEPIEKFKKCVHVYSYDVL